MDKKFVIENNILIEYNGTDKIVKVPENVTTIGPKCFYGNTTLEKVMLPKDCVELGKNAFCGCINLNEINLENIENINKSCFYGCSNLKVLVLDNIKNIRLRAFECSGLETLIINSNVEEIDYAFNGSNIKRISIEYLKKATFPLFNHCSNLKEIDIKSEFADSDDINKKYKIKDGMIYSTDETKLVYCPPRLELKEYRIPDTVKNIGEKAFGLNKNIEKIILGKNVREIDYDCFVGSNVKEIELNENLEKVESNGLLGIGGIMDFSKTKMNELDLVRMGLINQIPKTIILPNDLIKINLKFSKNEVKFIIENSKNKKIIDKIKSYDYVIEINHRTLEELIDEGKTFREASRIITNQER